MVINNGQGNLVLSGQGGQILTAANNGFLPNIKSRNAAQGHIYGGGLNQ